MNSPVLSQCPPGQIVECHGAARGLRHEQRITRNKGYIQFQDKVAELKSLRKRKTISLKESTRRAERDHLRKNASSREAPEDEDIVGGDGLLASERSLTSVLAAEKARKTARDVLLDESASILVDMVDLMNAPEVVQREKAQRR